MTRLSCLLLLAAVPFHSPDAVADGPPSAPKGKAKAPPADAAPDVVLGDQPDEDPLALAYADFERACAELKAATPAFDAWRTANPPLKAGAARPSVGPDKVDPAVTVEGRPSLTMVRDESEARYAVRCALSCPEVAAADRAAQNAAGRVVAAVQGLLASRLAEARRV